MKRLITTLVPIFVIFTLILAACGNNNSSSGGSSNNGVSQQGLAGGNPYNACPSSTNTTAAAPESGNISLTVSGWTSTPAEDALVQQNLNNFEKLHPNIHITWAPITGDYPTKMRANIASNTVPDVFYLQPAMSSEYISGGKLLNLSPYMARDGVKASDYYSALINPFVCTGGQVYGLPKDWNSLGVFYNKQMFQAAGVPFPTANWTWSDLQNDAQKLTKNPGSPNSVYGIVLSADLSRWGAFLFADGGSVLNKDGTQATFNNQQGVDALNYYDSFFKNNTGALPTTVGAGWNGEAFGKERAAMVIEGGWMLPFLSSTYPNVQYGIAPLPVASTGKRADLTFTNAWAAYSGTQHPEAAWELIKYMTGTTVQESQLNAGFALPTLKSLANAPYFSSNPGFKVLFDAAPYSYADYYGPQDATIHTDVSNAIDAVLLGKQDAQSALNDAATKVDSQLQAP
ncbi:MAG TPA: ABC transporter substrate-binding protein [Ktedonobacteraceae bacterium]|jgi:multiple sugar transport system substrate-binding protein|nr:ABC transporter substrate-binding protein [Ktedonobacteraceae bacterium]